MLTLGALHFSINDSSNFITKKLGNQLGMSREWRDLKMIPVVIIPSISVDGPNFLNFYFFPSLLIFVNMLYW